MMANKKQKQAEDMKWAKRQEREEPERCQSWFNKMSLMGKNPLGICLAYGFPTLLAISMRPLQNVEITEKKQLNLKNKENRKQFFFLL